MKGRKDIQHPRKKAGKIERESERVRRKRVNESKRNGKCKEGRMEREGILDSVIILCCKSLYTFTPRPSKVRLPLAIR